MRRRILARKASVAVVGQGYVGLTLACAAADEGFPVAGIDVDGKRIQELRRGNLCVPGVRERDFRAGMASGTLAFSTEPSTIEEADIVLICVPTPLKDHAPDLSFVQEATQQVADHLRPGSLVVLESTTYPGTTDEILVPILETSGLRAGREFLIAYSPERIDPGNEEYHLRNTPKVVGGSTPEAAGLTTLFYSQLVDKVVVVSSCRAAEVAKLLENTFRHVNVALANEIAMLGYEMGIDVWEVIDAAATKPFGFMSFYPGPGVGGHCIPLDPTYLSWQVRRTAGHQFRILEEAQDINAQMPGHVAGRIGDLLNDQGKAVNGAKVFVLGVSYKADVGDVRESPALKVMAQLARKGARLTFHDPYVESVAVSAGLMPRTELTVRSLSTSDCVALLTPHRAYDLDWIADHAPVIFDARNAYNSHWRKNVVRL